MSVNFYTINRQYFEDEGVSCRQCHKFISQESEKDWSHLLANPILYYEMFLYTTT